MTYILWTLPALAVIAAIASGRLGTLAASLVGLCAALLVALTTAPFDFRLPDAVISLARGAWIGWIVVPYILGGLLFWQMAIRPGNAAMPVETHLSDARARRRLLFTACFLIGPFAESATGFGVGIIGTMMLVRRLDVAPIALLAFSLLSQTMILWGGMGSGAIVAAAFARTDPTTLAVHASFFLVAFNVLWLPLYWRMADKAGITGGWGERIGEAAWLGASLAAVIAATALLGPETAMLAAYGPMIVLRYLADERPDRRTLSLAVRRMAPFALLIGWLVLTRLLPPLAHFLEATGRARPFSGAPTWSPLFHAGTWLVVGAVLTGLVRGHVSAFPAEIARAWKTGRLAVLTIVTFSMMAEVLSGSGIAEGLAAGMFAALDRWAIVATPLISAVFGSLANSGNAANGLFMASQVSLATEAGLNVAAVIALQHAAALSLNMVSPVRMSIVCGLAGTPGREREAYRVMLPFALVIAAVLVVASCLIATRVL
ncbi:L-lactate permease [Microvirga sp. 3-52]|uniref:L-lactate permease n=1 Tax=Microvirga sp. 3-52 TaxID=2792425 RepID=UPI001AC63A96|nr:L-lactate permease [Microvirga sp. 3-52]MBO1905327.1 L-lactate permease [Microvirga sp. 3-52]MBS7452584.1 L-lactate permease [Microvirga sp. 3-52]